MKHDMQIIEVLTGTCSEGCYKHWEDRVMCSCGWEKPIPQLSNFSYKNRVLANFVMLEHRFELLEKQIKSIPPRSVLHD